MRLFLPVLLLLVGCPEPPSTPLSADMTGAQPANPANPSGPGPGAAAPAVSPDGGTPGEPVGGTVVGSQIAPSAGRMDPLGFQVKSGQGIKISGVVTYDGARKGVIRIDFLRQPAEKEGLPELLHTLSLDSPQAFDVEAPKDLGEIGVVAFIDSNENGPSEGEPVWMEKVTVGSTPVTDLKFALSDDKLAPVGPGGPPPGNGPSGAAPGSPPPTDAPPEGAPTPGGPGPGAPAPDGAAPTEGTSAQ